MDREPLLRGRPIALIRVDGHASWVSSRVLELMGKLPDKVEGGSIVRYANGKPTGRQRNPSKVCSTVIISAQVS